MCEVSPRDRGDNWGAGTRWWTGSAAPEEGDRATRAPRSRSSTDGRRGPHPGMDEALVAVDSRRQRCCGQRAAGCHGGGCEAPAGEPGALGPRGEPQKVGEGLDAAAAEVGDLGEGVVLAAAVLGGQRAAGVEVELGGGEAPGGGAALGGGWGGAPAPAAAGPRSSGSAASPAIVARRRVRCGLEDSILSPFSER